ncbi:BTAD domain-containing putative transcriptional regulator [Deinococcus radiotolerans]|uniref:Bacterial transcriptional activator domain-containing protein n=1 Tax=Deinococcus radiotolerans TaxID=1309407 RepID=A0ABQ2FN81_9DEIO|nr:AAA family ATPase [Deinococcus radiotolerans]GGL10694.1 hypothetical protein GCM10010844_31680 [Deinococcus radiotolerans]
MIPRPLRHELHRTHLLDRVDRSDETLILLVAPSGFGKTTLLAQCARQEDRRAAWLSLNADDRDPAVFNTRLLRALQTAFPDAQLPDGRPEFVDARACARALNALNDHVLLALDHLHLAHVNTLRWLAEFIQDLHEGHRVLAAAPRRPALPLPTAFMAERLLLISGDQLRFTPQETQLYFERRGLTPPNLTDTRGLSGWPAGLALLAADAHGTFSPLDLVRDLLQRLPEPVRSALPEAATLEEWSEAGARDAHLSLPSGWLQAVQDAGLPLTPTAPDRFVPLQAVRDVLREDLSRSPDRAAQLYHRAAEQAEARGEPLLALQHYERGGHAQPAQVLASRLCSEYLWRIDYPSVLSTLESLRRWQTLPPPLEAALALALIRTDRVQEGETLAATLLERTLEPDALRALAHAAHRRGDRHMQLHYAQLLAQHALTRSQRADAARLEVAALLRLGRPQDAAARAEVLLDTSQALHPLEWAGTYFTLHTVYEDLRDPALSEQHLRSALDLYESMHSHQQIAVCLNDLAILRGQAGAHDEAQQLVTRALHLIGDSMPDLRVVYLETQADLLLWNADFSGAEQAYAHALTAAQERHLAPLVTRIQLGRAHALTQLGAFADAHTALEGATANLPPTDQPLRATLNFMRGVLAFAQGHGEQAQTLWQDAPAEYQDLRQAYLGLSAAQPTPPPLPGHLRRAHSATLRPHTPTRASTPGATSNLTSSPAAPPPTLHLHTCGPMHATLNGTPLHLPFSRAAELLAYLTLTGEASRAQIIRDLWDGSSETRVVNYAKLTIRKLRAALQDHLPFNPLPFEENLYALSPLLTVHSDAADILAAEHSTDPDLLRRAVHAHTAPFMPALEGEWAEATRERLQAATQTAGLRLIGHADLPEAISTARHLLRLDPLHEDTYLALLNAHERAGDPVGAQGTYREYERMLTREMGTHPPEALRARYVT